MLIKQSSWQESIHVGEKTKDIQNCMYSGKKTKYVQDWRSLLNRQSSYQECIYFGCKTKDIQSFTYARMCKFWEENKRQTKLQIGEV